MATFPITEARQELGVTPATAVRADIDVRTGEGAVGAAIGRGMLGLSEEFLIINAKTQLSEQNMAASDEINRFFIELQDNNDPETYAQSLDGLFDELNRLVPKNQMAARVYNQRLARLKLSVAKETRTAAGERIISNAQATDFLLLQKAKESGDFTEYKASVINGVKLGTYNAKVGESLLDAADREKIIAADNRAAAAAWATAEAIIEVGGYNQAIKYINGFEALKKENRNDIITRIKRLRDVNTASHNPDVYWPTLRKVMMGELTDNEIADLVKPNSLDTNDGKELIKINKDPSHPLRNPAAQSYFSELTKLRNANVFGDKDDLETSKTFLLKEEILRQFFLDKPDASAKQRQEFFIDLVSEEKRDYIRDLLNAFFVVSPLGGLTKRLYQRFRKPQDLRKEVEPLKQVQPQQRFIKIMQNKEGKRVGWNGIEWVRID